MTRRYTGLCLAAVALLLAAAEPAPGAEDGAHMQPPLVDMAPASNKQIELIVRVGFTGGCCFTLTTYDVAARITLPAGVTLTSGPEPPHYAQIVGPPGGVKQEFAEFRWRVRKADENAVYPVKITVTTRNSGEARKDFLLTRPVACAIGTVEAASPTPSRREIPVRVDVVSNKEDRYVAQVRLCYATGVPKEALANKERVKATSGGLTCVVNGKPLVRQAAFVTMSRKYEPTLWRAAIPPQEPTGLGVWIDAVDSAGERTLGDVHHLEVVDFARSAALLRVTNWTLAIGTFASLGLMRRRRRFRIPRQAGLWPVGGRTGLRGGGLAVVDDAARRRQDRRDRIAVWTAVACGVLLVVTLVGTLPQQLVSALKGTLP